MIDSIKKKQELTESDGDLTLMNKCQVNQQIFLNDNEFMQFIKNTSSTISEDLIRSPHSYCVLNLVSHLTFTIN